MFKVYQAELLCLYIKKHNATPIKSFPISTGAVKFGIYVYISSCVSSETTAEAAPDLSIDIFIYLNDSVLLIYLSI